MRRTTRRQFVKAAGATVAGALVARTALSGAPAGRTVQTGLGLGANRASDGAGVPGERARQDPGVKVLHPRDRVPLSFFIDDSTCLANMGYYCMPQFATAWPDSAEYKKPWKTWPREIPDAFLREFGTWCAEHGVKGKFSIVPYPACVGWLDRELPGWSRRELLDSLKLVRELMVPGWDIHPEMISHTRVIDLKTGRPLEEVSAATMENSYPQAPKSVDELAGYLAYALRILKNCDLPCEGITTPGGFGNRVKSELSLAVEEAVREVYAAEIPHYFKYVSEGEESTDPTLEHVSALDGGSPRLTVNIPAGTGDWFGSWDGDSVSQGQKYTSDDGTRGRMVELIESGRPAIMLCHWPGLYGHGTKRGFEEFKKGILGLEARHSDRTIWMKSSEIARYWAAKELTRIERKGSTVTLDAPFACPRFTLRIEGRAEGAPRVSAGASGAAPGALGGTPMRLKEVARPKDLDAGSWLRREDGTVVCLELPKGKTVIDVG